MSVGHCSLRSGKGASGEDGFRPHTKGFPGARTSAALPALPLPSIFKPCRGAACESRPRAQVPGLQTPGLTHTPSRPARPLAALPVWGATGVWGWGLSAAGLAAPHPARHCTASSSPVGAEAGGSSPHCSPTLLGGPRHAHLTPPHPTPLTACGGRGAGSRRPGDARCHWLAPAHPSGRSSGAGRALGGVARGLSDHLAIASPGSGLARAFTWVEGWWGAAEVP